MIQKLRLAFKLMWRHPSLTLAFLASAGARAGLIAAFFKLIQGFLKKALATTAGTGSEGLWLKLAVVAGLILVCWVGRSVADYYAKVLQAELGRRVEMTLRLDLVEHLLKLSLGFFNRHSKGQILRAVNSDAASLRLLVHHTAGLIISSVQIGMLFGVAFTLDPTLTMWGLIGLPFAVVPLSRIGSKIYSHAEESRFQGVTITNLLFQVLSGIRIVKVFQGEHREAKACHRSAMELLKASMGIVKRQSTASVLLDGLSGFGIFFVIILGGIRVSGGKMDIPTFITFVLALQVVLGSTRQILNVYGQIKIQSVAIDKIDMFLAEKPEIKDSKDAVPLTSPPRRLEFQNVDYSYNSEPILRNISFVVKAGETIGIVGRTGVGKTTLLNLVARFYDPTKGKILLDGIDLRKIKISNLMRQLAIVTQEPFLFQVSVMENIRYGRPDATDEEVIAAAKAANIHNDIVSWPDGYETVIGPTRADVSVGQKQRINIARAILKNAPILLLDEATSALDSKTERQVQESLDKLMRKCTTLVVAHRLSTLREADKILVLADGTVEAFAPHEELLRTSPTYQELWRAQQRQMGQTDEPSPAGAQ